MSKDHFVPQFYLNGFTDPSSTTYPDPYLWVVDLQNKSLRKRSPKNIAYIRGFYDWKEVEEGVPTIEEIYSAFESLAAPIIYKLRGYARQNIQLTIEDCFYLSNFLGVQLTRDPRFRGNAREKLSMFITKWLNDLAKDDNRLKKEFPEDDIKEVQKTLQKTTLIPTPDCVLSSTLMPITKLAEFIFCMEWLFLKSEGMDFLTTDQPLSLYTTDGKPPTNFKAEVSMFFPISPSLLLYMQNKRQPRSLGLIKAKEVTLINRKLLSVADRYIFCSCEELGEWVLGQIPISPEDVQGGSLVIYPV